MPYLTERLFALAMTAVELSAIGRSNVERPTRLRKATARQAPHVQSKRMISADLDETDRQWGRPRNCRLTIRETGIVFDEAKLSQEQEENHESSADQALRK